MILRKLYNTLAVITGITLPLALHAQGIPVFDNTANLKLIEQYLNAQQQLEMLTSQYQQDLRAYESMTGTRDMGDFANTSADALLRRYTPDNMDTLLDIDASSGLPAAISSNFTKQKSLYKPLTAAELNSSKPDRPEVVAYEQHVKTTYAATAASEAAYNNAANNLETYEGLLNELNNTQDLKASVDLQTRASIQNGLLMNELLKQNALLLQLQATENNQELVGRRQTYDANSTN